MASLLAARRAQLGAALAATRELWSPQPWHDPQPAWTRQRPQLRDDLLALDEAATARLAADPGALDDFLRGHVPELGPIVALSAVEPAPGVELQDPGRHFDWAIPGRKRQQIEAFAAAVGRPQAPVLDWCAGKGHLGRFLSAQWHCPVDSVDHDPALVAAAGQLARRARQDGQTAGQVDVLAAASGLRLAGRHVVALHACGDLHRRLVSAAADAVAVDVAPCCHDRGAAEQLGQPGLLPLDRKERRLAVTGIATAAARETALRCRENAWKLGFMALLAGRDDFSVMPLRPVAGELLREDFAGFCRRLAEREGLALPADADFAAAEAAGAARWRRVQSLDLLRFAFRRPLEVFMALDLAMPLESSGFSVRLASFCDVALTPRNLLVSARRH